jgi:hypothetical protein
MYAILQAYRGKRHKNRMLHAYVLMHEMMSIQASAYPMICATQLFKALPIFFENFFELKV